MNIAIQCHTLPNLAGGGGGRPLKLVSAAKILKLRVAVISRSYRNYQIPLVSLPSPILGGGSSGGGHGRANWKICGGSDNSGGGSGNTGGRGKPGLIRRFLLFVVSSWTNTIIATQIPFIWQMLSNTHLDHKLQVIKAENERLRNGDNGSSKEQNPETGGKQLCELCRRSLLIGTP